jgi:hypothetical protein
VICRVLVEFVVSQKRLKAAGQRRGRSRLAASGLTRLLERDIADDAAPVIGLI